MRRETTNYFVVGLFVAGALAAFLILMYVVTGRTGPSDRYHAHYENVTGIKFGTGVFYEGYRVGQVEEVEPVPAPKGMHYRVTFSVARNWRIPADSSVEVVSAGLISEIQLQIREGRSTRMLSPGDEIRGAQQQDLFSALSAAASGFSDLSASGVAPVLRNLDGRISQVADEIVAFRRDDIGPLVRNLDRTLNQDLAPRASRTLARLDETAARLETLLGPATERRVTALLTHADELFVNTNRLVTGLDETRGQLAATLRKVDGLVEKGGGDLTRAVRDAREVLARLDSTLTIIDEDIDTVMYNLDGSARHMHEFARALRENPARLLRSPDAPPEPAP